MSTKSNQSKKSAKKVYKKVCAFQSLPMSEQLKKWNEHIEKIAHNDAKDIMRELQENEYQPES